MSLFAVVPLKNLDQAKSRLAGCVADRPALALALLGVVLKALEQTAGIDRILVTSPDARVRDHCPGATFVHQRGRGLNPALEHARRLALSQGADDLLVVLADLGGLTPQALQAMLGAGSPPPAVVAAPDRLGTGTNVLLLRPANLLPFRFGRGSLDRHRRDARRLGVPLALFDHPATKRDVDLPEHLQEVVPS